MYFGLNTVTAQRRDMVVALNYVAPWHRNCIQAKILYLEGMLEASWVLLTGTIVLFSEQVFLASFLDTSQ